MSDVAALGAHLRRCREEAGLTPEEVARRSRIPPRILRALEDGRLEAMPAPVYLRGFIRSYCGEVGADPDPALALYEAACPAAGPSPSLVPAASGLLAAAPARRPQWRRAVTAAVAAVTIVSGTTAIVYLVATRRPASAPPARAVVATPAPVSSGPRERVLVVRVDETTWLRVLPGAGQAWEATLPPGSIREWRTADRFTLTVGNAGGVRLELDGQPLPPLGARGVVVRDVVIPKEGSP